MRSWPDTPALVCGRWMDVLATNSLADALHNGHEYTDNLLQLVFLEPAAREFYRDWEKVAHSKVAHLRAAAGADLDDPYLTELIGELSDESSEFCRSGPAMTYPARPARPSASATARSAT